MSSSRQQIDSLTGLRGVAACWVMLMHFREVTPTRVWHYPLIDSVIANGAYGVDVFFVLSGFVLSYVYAASFTTSLGEDKVFRFLIYRFARIYPVHLITFGFMVTLYFGQTVTSGDAGVPGRYDAATLLSSVVLIHAWYPGMQTPNMPAWSISAEWFAYILFPALCFFIARTRWALPLYMAAGLGLAYVQPLGNFTLTHVLSGFLLGMVTYRLVGLSQRIRTGHVAGVAIGAMILFWASRPEPSSPLGLLLFSALMLALTDERDLLSRALSLRPMIYLGEISYSLYMVHWPVRVILRYGFHALGVLDTLPSPALAGCYASVTLVLAIASYHYVELPGRALLRRAADRYAGARVTAAISPE